MSTGPGYAQLWSAYLLLVPSGYIQWVYLGTLCSIWCYRVLLADILCCQVYSVPPPQNGGVNHMHPDSYLPTLMVRSPDKSRLISFTVGVHANILTPTYSQYGR